MKAGKSKRALLCCCLITMGMLCGCWDRVEINDVAFVIGSSFDKINDKFVSTVQIALPSQLGGTGSEGGGGGTSGNQNYLLISKKAQTMYLATKEIQDSLSRILNFSHRRLMIFGEGFARDGIGNKIDILGRFPQNRLSAYVVLTRGRAYDILTAEAPIEQFPAEMAREIAKSSIRNPMNVKRMVNKLLSDGVDLYLPVMSVKDSSKEVPNKSKSLISIDGLGVFKDDRLVGLLNEEDGLMALLGMGESLNPKIILPRGGKDKLITINLSEPKTWWTPSVQDSQFAIAIHFQGKGSILENTSNEDIENENLSGLEEQCRNYINANLSRVVEKLQREYQSDIFGFGQVIKSRYPQEWEKVKDRWHEVYPTVEVSIHSTIHLESTNQLMNSLSTRGGRQNND
ncbi:Ger(x)C family spore germination protein [Paenibacillus lutimineralis]|uniref:Ger(X)C family spore germination protein n=1 Tax=Paenibacillus lutimineralis TaxID=2707005 RepID=A0A3Q9IGT8_9BACL|nr:Ger(x)C family spore germination protein [Paenibacillus lutimineralis]AZS17691.1 Ger(x)C family spore germination protein [Paenibacillus lutimineralis]